MGVGGGGAVGKRLLDVRVFEGVLLWDVWKVGGGECVIRAPLMSRVSKTL